MDLSRIRAGINLRSLDVGSGSSVETLTQRRGFDLNKSESGIGEYQRYIQAFNIERWLKPLDGVTFPTVMSDISPAEARELAGCYESFKSGVESIQPSHTLIESLQRSVEEVDHGCGVFIKTSSRSAKDFANHERLQAEFGTRLANLPNPTGHEGTCENDQMIAMSYASMELLRMRSASEALEFFAKSERTWNDMVLALACEENGWEEHAIVRRWVDLEPDMEFRCFVANGCLTAISQYHHLVYFPRLVSNRDSVLLRLLAAFHEISPRLEGITPRNGYVLDIAVELRSGEASLPGITSREPMSADAFVAVWAVEVNPFFDTADGCLCSWTKNLSLLITPVAEGTPPDFRIRTAPARGSSSLLYKDWKEAIRTAAEQPQRGAAAFKNMAPYS